MHVINGFLIIFAFWWGLGILGILLLTLCASISRDPKHDPLSIATLIDMFCASLCGLVCFCVAIEICWEEYVPKFNFRDTRLAKWWRQFSTKPIPWFTWIRF